MESGSLLAPVPSPASWLTPELPLRLGIIEGRDVFCHFVNTVDLFDRQSFFPDTYICAAVQFKSVDFLARVLRRVLGAARVEDELFHARGEFKPQGGVQIAVARDRIEGKVLVADDDEIGMR